MCQDHLRILNGCWKTLRIILSSSKRTGGYPVKSKLGNPQHLEKYGQEFGTQPRKHRNHRWQAREVWRSGHIGLEW
eukprot:3931440-Heterocapsa_arctica.AAC.1